jgi:hypothetical protein
MIGPVTRMHVPTISGQSSDDDDSRATNSKRQVVNVIDVLELVYSTLSLKLGDRILLSTQDSGVTVRGGNTVGGTRVLPCLVV